MNFVIWLVVGGVLGWIASILMKTDGQQGIIPNVVVGVVGSMVAGWLITPLVGIGTISQEVFSFPAMLVSLLGAVVLLGIFNVLRHGSVR